MAQQKKFKMISEHDMARELELLKQHRVDEFMKYRYTVADVEFMTGYSSNYLRILERAGKIPKALRDDTIRGVGPKHGPMKGCRHWGEDEVRAILCYAKEHEGHFRGKLPPRKG